MNREDDFPQAIVDSINGAVSNAETRIGWKLGRPPRRSLTNVEQEAAEILVSQGFQEPRNLEIPPRGKEHFSITGSLMSFFTILAVMGMAGLVFSPETYDDIQAYVSRGVHVLKGVQDNNILKNLTPPPGFVR